MNYSRLGFRSLVIAIGLAASAQTAHAQLGWTVYGVGEFDTSDVVLVLGGVSVGPARQGWVPVVGVSASWLQYPSGALVGDDNVNVTTIMPSIGIANNFNGGSAQLRAGYAFADGDDVVAPVVAADVGRDGAVGIAQVDYWGTGKLGAQAIASYNFGGEAFWGRGRLTYRIMSLGNSGDLRIGPEVAFLESDEYTATQVGGVLGFNAGAGTLLTGGIGRKLTDDGEDATYFRFEIVLTPR
jgi:hypothetical protein